MMNSMQLGLLRRLLFYSCPEAAALVAAGPERPDGIKERTWRQMEAGERRVPPDIEANINSLIEWRESKISELLAATAIERHYFGSIDEWLAVHEHRAIHFRPYQSALAEIMASERLTDQPKET